MKLKLSAPKADKDREVKRGRKSFLGEKPRRLNFFLSRKEHELMVKLSARADRLGVNPRVTVSRILREGGLMFIKKCRAMLDKLENRKPQFNIKLKHEN